VEALEIARNLLIVNFGVTFPSSNFTQIIFHALISSLGSFLQYICIAETTRLNCQPCDRVRHLSLKLGSDAAICFGRDAVLEIPAFFNILFLQAQNTNMYATNDGLRREEIQNFLNA
jgi:hypothetical protein